MQLDGRQRATATGPAPVSTAMAANATVRSVTDGDTIDVTIGDQQEAVRLIGIDTPEVKDPDKPVECYGEAASAFTKQLLPRARRSAWSATSRHGTSTGACSPTSTGPATGCS